MSVYTIIINALEESGFGFAFCFSDCYLPQKDLPIKYLWRLLQVLSTLVIHAISTYYKYRFLFSPVRVINMYNVKYDTLVPKYSDSEMGTTCYLFVNIDALKHSKHSYNYEVLIGKVRRNIIILRETKVFHWISLNSLSVEFYLIS